MANLEGGSKDQIHVVNTFQKEVESLEKSFKEMLQTIQDSKSNSPEATLQHILLLDHAVDQATVKVGEDFASLAKMFEAASEKCIWLKSC